MNTTTETRLVTLKILDLARDNTPRLYDKCDGTPAGAFITMNEQGVIGTRVSFKHEGTPESIWHERILTWVIPIAVKACELREVLQDEAVLDLFERVYVGHSVDWNGNNYVGVLDGDARDASAQLEDRFYDLSDAACIGQVWSCGDWLGEAPLREVWPAAHTLTQAASKVREEASRQEVVLSDDLSLESYLVERLLDAYEDDKLTELSATQRAAVEADSANNGSDVRLVDIES